MANNDWIVFDGELLPADTPVVPAVSRGLMYGDGVFETFRTYSGQTLFLQDHLDRLHYGCQVLGILFPPQLKKDSLRQLLHRFLQKKHLLAEDTIIRLQVWREGKRGYQPDLNADAHFSITASVCAQEFSFPKLVTVDRKRIPSASMPSDIKLTNGINYILAANEAAAKGGDDALMQTIDGWISETTIANIFWIKNDTFYTPATDCDLIPGITRDILLQLIEESNWDVKQSKFDLGHILAADAVWICNSVREVLPVRQVNRQKFNTENELLKELQSRFIAYRDRNLKSLDS